MFTVCISDSILEADWAPSSQKSAVDSLCDALINCLRELRDDDFVLFNIGNTSVRLLNDDQANIEDWDTVQNKFQGFSEKIGLQKTFQMMN